jgi:hypothetical protein
MASRRPELYGDLVEEKAKKGALKRIKEAAQSKKKSSRSKK